MSRKPNKNYLKAGTRYHYSVVLLDETPYASGARRKEFSREYGIEYAATPLAAATYIEKGYNRKNYIVDCITIRLVSENGQILLQTQKDDMTDQLALAHLPHSIGIINPESTVFTNLPKEAQKSFDVYKFLTPHHKGYGVIPTLRVKDHLS